MRQLGAGEHRVAKQYARVVKREVNRPAQDLINKGFQVTDRKWRGIGEIPLSGLGLRAEYKQHDAEQRFDMEEIIVDEPEACISGIILQGLKKPNECPAFGTLCTPRKPLGATMVSSEGACAAYYAYPRAGSL